MLRKRPPGRTLPGAHAVEREAAYQPYHPHVCGEDSTTEDDKPVDADKDKQWLATNHPGHWRQKIAAVLVDFRP